MATVVHNGTEYEVSDVESFNKKQEEGGEKGDHVMKFTMESDFGTDFIRYVANPTDNVPDSERGGDSVRHFTLKAAGVETTVRPYDSSIVIQDTLNQLNGEEVTVVQIALISAPDTVQYE
ncbi:hypothetical protein M1M34_gp042 [Haloarcula tailed virus 2]|uniref:Uncharacterized protein n=1 Tax=Haloarcula tailed virus 2 TaxID=2877989 RepID=A0AAE9BZ99_9CAUD|nr:hypothetical protein M1M34_gp042 [Haloarcula tailed virus 2]UBF23193.1 hypothetical protein HATV-2_gp42 [Haloarcula tailed virus 2]